MGSVAPNPSTVGKTRLIENVLLVNAVNLLNFVFSVMANVVIPANTQKVDFANYRLLVLYAGYAGFVHFGLLSGLYLYVVGRNLQELDLEVIASIKRALLVLMIVVLPVTVFLFFKVVPESVDRRILFVSVGAWGVLNFITFHNYLYQGTGNFRTFAAVNFSAMAIGIVVVAYFVLTHAMATWNLVVAF